LLFQRQREVRPPAFVHSVTGPTRADFRLAFIFKRDALERLGRMQVLRKITFRVARPEDPMALRGQDPSAAHAIDLLNELGGREIDINVSVGRPRRIALQRNPVLRMANVLFNRRDAEVQKIIVSGRGDPDAATETIDLLEDRLVYEAQANLRRRRLDSRDCVRALQEAYREHADYLRELRPPE